MNVLWKGFLGRLHSWSQVAQNLSRQFKNNNYNIDLFSTNGISHFPEDLKENLIGYVGEIGEHSESVSLFPKSNKTLDPEKGYDVQCSYTAMHNFKNYFSNGTKNRLATWCYEFSGKNALPTGFAKNHVYVDYLLPPSEHARQVFLDSGIPDKKLKIIPHGYSEDFINRSTNLNLELNKKYFVFGANIAQPHLRKNIPGIIESFFKAFTKKDNVCLLFKISKSSALSKFEVDFDSILSSYKIKYKNHPKVVVISDYIENISDFYRSCDAIISLSHAESFLLPALETLVAGKILICSNYGGQLDFCNKKNSFLVDGSLVRANPNMLYWESKPNTIVFEPSIDDAVAKLRFVYENHLCIDFSNEFEKIRSEYTWQNAFKKLEGLIT